MQSAHGWGLDGETLQHAGARSRASTASPGSTSAIATSPRICSHRADARGRVAQPHHGGNRATHSACSAQVMPMSDDRVRTFVKVRGRGAMPFQEYFVRRRSRGTVEQDRAARRRRARGHSARRSARFATRSAVILAPSNPFVSIGPILALDGMREAMRRVRPRVAAISPIVGGKAIKGPGGKDAARAGASRSPRSASRGFIATSCAVFVLDNADRRCRRTRSKNSGCARSSPTPSWPTKRVRRGSRTWFCARLRCSRLDRRPRMRNAISDLHRNRGHPDGQARATISPR